MNNLNLCKIRKSEYKFIMLFYTNRDFPIMNVNFYEQQKSERQKKKMVPHVVYTVHTSHTEFTLLMKIEGISYTRVCSFALYIFIFLYAVHNERYNVTLQQKVLDNGNIFSFSGLERYNKAIAQYVNKYKLFLISFRAILQLLTIFVE